MTIEIFIEKSVQVKISENTIKEMINENVNLDSNSSIHSWFEENIEWDYIDEDFNMIDSISWNELEFEELVTKVKKELKEEKEIERLIEESRPLDGQIRLF